MPDWEWWLIGDTRLRLWCLVLFISVTGACADLSMARWARTGGNVWFWVSSVLWLVSVWLLGWLLKTDSRSLSRVLLLITVAHLLSVFSWELVVHRLRPTLKESLGMVLAIVGVVLLEWPESTTSARMVETCSPISLTAPPSDSEPPEEMRRGFRKG